MPLGSSLCSTSTFYRQAPCRENSGWSTFVQQPAKHFWILCTGRLVLYCSPPLASISASRSLRICDEQGKLEAAVKRSRGTIGTAATRLGHPGRPPDPRSSFHIPHLVSSFLLSHHPHFHPRPRPRPFSPHLASYCCAAHPSHGRASHRPIHPFLSPCCDSTYCRSVHRLTRTRIQTT